jgi:single-strand DNA-binding protein
MTDLNHVDLICRLTRDAELKYTAGGTAICKFGVAVNRNRKDGDTWKDEVSFIDIVVWGKQGESLHQYLVKGKQVGISGELRQERWQHEGQNKSRVEVVANNIQLLGGGNNSNGDSRPARQESSNGQTSTQTASTSDDSYSEDIPF